MYKPYKLNDVYKESEKELFTFADFFAGGGGSSTGLKLAGGKEIFINEFVEEACNTFAMNYPDVKIYSGDIKQLNPLDILKDCNLQAGELDILSGSPPCSAFSTAGKRDKGWKKQKTYSDNKKVENIEDLFFEYIRMIDGIKPKIAIAENVKGLTVGESKTYLAKIVNSFSNIGYECVYKVIKASDHGVPQTRERCIFIAVRQDVLDVLNIDLFSMIDLFPDNSNDRDVSLRLALEGVENDQEEVDMLEAYVQRTFQKKLIELLEKNPSKQLSPADPDQRHWNPKGSYFGFIRPCGDNPCPTLTQRGQTISTAGIFHYNEDRKFTIKELMILMSLPEDYYLTGTFDQKAERICRMVAPIMMKEIASTLHQKILIPYKKGYKYNE